MKKDPPPDSGASGWIKSCSKRDLGTNLLKGALEVAAAIGRQSNPPVPGDKRFSETKTSVRLGCGNRSSGRALAAASKR